MKKVTLLLPDDIYHTYGSSRSSTTELVDFTPDNFLNVLCEDSDYHGRYKLNFEDVELLSIEDVD